MKTRDVYSHWTNSIKTKIGLALVVVVTGILALFGIYEYVDTREALTRELNDLGDITVSRLADNLILPLWEVDNSWVSKIVKTEMLNRKIYAIFVGGEGNLFVGMARDTHWEPIDAVNDAKASVHRDSRNGAGSLWEELFHTKGGYVIRSKAVVRNGEEIGYAKIYVAKKFMAEQLSKDTLNLLFKVILLAVSILALLTLMMHKIIIHPINRILGIADGIAAGDYSRDVEISQNDEIGMLGKRINSMRENLRQREEELYRHREHLEDLVRTRTEDLNTAQRIAHLGNWVWEKPASRITWSDEIYRIFGLEPQEIKASYEEFLSRVHPEDREKVMKAFSESQRNGKPYKMEHRIVLADAVERIVYAQGEVTLDESRNPVRMVGTVQDITERVRTEQALRDSERRLAEIIDFLPEATLVIDTEGKVLAWNRALENMTGIRSRDILGKGDHEYAIPFYGDRRPILIDLAAKRDNDTNRRYVSLQEDGETLIADEAYCPNLRPGGAYVSSTARPLYDSRGNRVGAIESVRDITWRKQLEKELVAAKEAAEAANLAKSRFLATMSHELRTPMNAVMGMTYLCLQTETTSKQQYYLSTIFSSSQGLLRILNDILDLSKIEAGKLAIESVDFRLRDVLEGVINILAIKANEKGLDLLLSEDTNCPQSLVGDPVRLGQILINLVGNAIKFTDSGEVVIAVEPITEGPEGIMLRFSVRDTGIGLTQEQMSHLFEPFSQVDSSSSRKFGGTGLGLSICNRLVGMMGGRIYVESQPGKGSTFTFTVVCGRSNKKHETSSAPVVEVEGTVKPLAHAHPDTDIALRFKDVRALVVEDNEINQAVTADLLEVTGIDVTVAKDGREGIAALRDGDFDLVLMDIEMPVMDGYEAAAAIREDPRFSDVPIIAMTAHAMSGTRNKAIQAGMNDHITKPIDPRHLYSLIAKWISSKNITKKPIVPIERKSGLEESSSDPPGFDVSLGLKRLTGDRKLYRNLLSSFSEKHGRAADEIRSALRDNDVELAKRQAHTLQGVAGTIGATDLQSAVRDLEAALGQKDQRAWEERLDSVRRSLEQTLFSTGRLRSELEEALAGSSGNPEDFDFVKLSTLLAELKLFLENSDGRAVKTAEFITQYAKSSSCRAEVEKLERLVKGYDYDAALEVLGRLGYGDKGHD